MNEQVMYDFPLEPYQPVETSITVSRRTGQPWEHYMMYLPAIICQPKREMTFAEQLTKEVTIRQIVRRVLREVAEPYRAEAARETRLQCEIRRLYLYCDENELDWLILAAQRIGSQ